MKPPQVELNRRVQGAMLGLLIADALAMPAHWYYNTLRLWQDYGTIDDYLPPKSFHPDSILWRSQWHAPSPELDILGEQRPLWGQRGIHYHQNLNAGENTLTAKLAIVAWNSLHQRQGYDAADYQQLYVDLLTHPERHRDTYVEECHREFFTNLGKGRPPERCGVLEKHIGGLVTMLPVALYYADDQEQGRSKALEHLALTHPGPVMQHAAETILTLLHGVLNGTPLEQVIRHQCAIQHNPHFGFPFTKWLAEEDRQVIGHRLSTACYVDQAVPAVIYLALKYSRDPERGLIANTNLGGDNVHRGSVLGALLGAEHGASVWPKRWLDGLVARPSV